MKLKHFFLFIIVSFLLSFSGIGCSGSANPGNSPSTPSTPQVPVEEKDPVELDDTLTAMKLAQAM